MAQFIFSTAISTWFYFRPLVFGVFVFKKERKEFHNLDKTENDIQSQDDE